MAYLVTIIVLLGIWMVAHMPVISARGVWRWSLFTSAFGMVASIAGLNWIAWAGCFAMFLCAFFFLEPKHASR